MAAEQYLPSDVVSYPASGDHSSNQFKFVKFDTNGRIALTGATTDHPFGVLVNDPSVIDADAEVMGAVGKGVKLLVKANSPNIAVGDKVGTDALGFGVKKTSNDYCAIALEAATADSVVIGVVFVGNTEV